MTDQLESTAVQMEEIAQGGALEVWFAQHGTGLALLLGRLNEPPAATSCWQRSLSGREKFTLFLLVLASCISVATQVFSGVKDNYSYNRGAIMQTHGVTYPWNTTWLPISRLPYLAIGSSSTVPITLNISYFETEKTIKERRLALNVQYDFSITLSYSSVYNLTDGSLFPPRIMQRFDGLYNPTMSGGFVDAALVRKNNKFTTMTLFNGDSEIPTFIDRMANEKSTFIDETLLQSINIAEPSLLPSEGLDLIAKGYDAYGYTRTQLFDISQIIIPIKNNAYYAATKVPCYIVSGTVLQNFLEDDSAYLGTLGVQIKGFSTLDDGLYQSFDTIVPTDFKTYVAPPCCFISSKSHWIDTRPTPSKDELDTLPNKIADVAPFPLLQPILNESMKYDVNNNNIVYSFELNIFVQQQINFYARNKLTVRWFIRFPPDLIVDNHSTTDMSVSITGELSTGVSTTKAEVAFLKSWKEKGSGVREFATLAAGNTLMINLAEEGIPYESEYNTNGYMLTKYEMILPARYRIAPGPPDVVSSVIMASPMMPPLQIAELDESRPLFRDPYIGTYLCAASSNGAIIPPPPPS